MKDLKDQWTLCWKKPFDKVTRNKLGIDKMDFAKINCFGRDSFPYLIKLSLKNSSKLQFGQVVSTLGNEKKPSQH